LVFCGSSFAQAVATSSKLDAQPDANLLDGTLRTSAQPTKSFRPTRFIATPKKLSAHQAVKNKKDNSL
jgi:hypothetical protein